MKYNSFYKMMKIIYQETSKTWLINLGNQVEVTNIDKIREKYKNNNKIPPSYTAFVVKAISLAIKDVSLKYPEINAMICGFGSFKYMHVFKKINAGIAISREEHGIDCVYIGVLEETDKMHIEEISHLLHQFSTQPIDIVLKDCNRLYEKPSFIQKILLGLSNKIPCLRAKYRGTFGITTVGKFGIDWQLSLPGAGHFIQFGFGSIKQRPVVRNKDVVAVNTMNLTMCFNRLQMNGKPCSLLMEKIKENLENATI